jgi:hypothetical protein
MALAPAGSMWGTYWVDGGEVGATMEAVGGVVSTACDANVEARVIRNTSGMEVKAGVIGATYGAGVGAVGVGVAIEPLVSTTWAVESPRGMV